MLHRIIDWLGYKLHIKKYTMDDVTRDLINIVVAVSITTIALKIISEMRTEMKLLPWYTRLWFWLKEIAYIVRIKAIGY